MKRIIAIAMCLALTAAAVQVSAQNRGENNRPEQERRTPEEAAKMQADRMKEQLDLTDAQHAQVLELFKEQMKKREERTISREEMEKLTDEQRAERREEMRKMREENDAKLKKILTEEQFAKYEENRRNEPRGNMSGGGQRGGERPAGNRNQ